MGALHTFAQNITNCEPGTSGAAAGGCDTILPSIAAGGSAQSVIFSILFGILGALALFFVIYGGFKFVVSEGEPEKIAKARQTIIFAIIGLVIAIAAEIIVAVTIGTL